MTALLAVLAVLGVCAVGVTHAWWRTDDLKATNRDLTRRLARAVAERDEATDLVVEAEENARRWAAYADERTVELERHLATCLGERITLDSERRN